MEFTDEDKAARAASIAEFPSRQSRPRPKWFKYPKRRRRPKTFGQMLDRFEEDIRFSYRSGWKCDQFALILGRADFNLLHIKRSTMASVIVAKLNRRGLTTTKVAGIQGRYLILFLVEP